MKNRNKYLFAITFAGIVCVIAASQFGINPAANNADTEAGEPETNAITETVAGDSDTDDSGTDESETHGTLYSNEGFLEAAAKGDAKVVRLALESGTDANATGSEGNRSALQLAAFDGHDEVVWALLQAGADVNHLDATDRSALMYASTGDNAGTVKILLKAGAKIDLADNHEGFTALMFAAAEGQAKVVNTLLSAGADHTMKDTDGDTAKSFAEKNGHGVVVALIEKMTSEEPEKMAEEPEATTEEKK